MPSIAAVITRNISRLSLTLLLLLFFASPASANLTRPTCLSRLIVKFNHSDTASQLNTLVTEPDIYTSRRLLTPRTFLIQTSPLRTQALLLRLSHHPDIDYIETDAVASSFTTPNDPLYSQQWSLNHLYLPQVWEQTTGNASTTIAILDSGIDDDHPDISSKVTDWTNFTDSSTTADLIGHGTHVAGIAAASTDNFLGVAGVGYHTSLMSVKVLSDRGYGYYSWIADGIYYAVDHHAQVINLSLGGRTNSNTLNDAITYAWQHDVVIVAAAGNNHSARPMYPAAFDQVIAVAATNQNDAKASFSNYGTWVDLAAPGVDIFSTVPNQPHSFSDSLGYGLATGTSMAAPHVSAVAALLSSAHPNWDNNQIVNQLTSTATPITGSGYYWQSGLLNPIAAFDIIPSPTPMPSPSPSSTPNPTPTPTLTPTPSLTPSPSPSLPPTPTPTPSPTPTISPTPSPPPSSTPTPSSTPNPLEQRRQAIQDLIRQRLCRLRPGTC